MATQRRRTIHTRAMLLLGLGAGLAACSAVLGDFTVDGSADESDGSAEAGSGTDGASPNDDAHTTSGDATSDSPETATGSDGASSNPDAHAQTSDASDGAITSDSAGAHPDGGLDASDGATDAEADSPTCSALDGGDPSNCGACGHSCQTGSCVSGRCQPFSISGPTTQPVSLAVNESKAFWQVAQGLVLSEPVSGATAGSTLYAASNAPVPPTNIAIDSTSAYWPDFAVGQGPVVESQVFGGNSAFRYGSEANSNGRYTFLVEDGTNIFAAYVFVSVQGGACPSAGVDHMAIQPRSTAVATWSLTSFCRVNRMAVDATNLYWTDLGAPNGSLAPGVFMAPKLGTTSMLVSSASTPTGIAVFQGTLYWSDTGTGDIMRWTAGGAPSIVSSSPLPGDIAVDADGVYWIDSGTMILRAPLTGTMVAAQPLATGQTAAAAIATNSTSVFWLDTGTSANQFADGAVMKLAK